MSVSNGAHSGHARQLGVQACPEARRRGERLCLLLRAAASADDLVRKAPHARMHARARAPRENFSSDPSFASMPLRSSL
jgi:hypothetical protein